MPFRLAHRIATNRTMPGVHFPVDSMAGAYLGCFVGEALIALVTGDALLSAQAGPLDLASEQADPLNLSDVGGEDFLLDNLAGMLTGWSNCAQAKADTNQAETAILRQFWEGVAREWDRPKSAADGGA